jgi:hypothetical protein
MLHVGARRLALAAVAACCAPIHAGTTPGDDATVFIRVTGSMRAEFVRGWKQAEEKPEVEIGTGSGFVVSPYGHILTNHHVVSGAELTVVRAGTEYQVRLEVDRIEVGLPGRPGTGPTRLVATVDAVDPERDLALLSVLGADLPHMPFGDSDALEPGQPVEVRGYPFGRQVEVAKATATDLLPQVSVSRGSVAALRTDDQGVLTYIQTDAVVNPGSSGGPVLDQDGFVVGVVRMKLSGGPGVGFAIPINQVKDFLELNGLDHYLPSGRLRLGPREPFDWKGLRMRLIEGVVDASPTRLRVESDRTLQRVHLIVDRVATPFALPRLEETLLSSQGYRRVGRWSLGDGLRPAPPALVGTAARNRTSPDPAPTMEYVLLDLGDEKIVARYVGPRLEVAFNRGALRRSLTSLEADSLLTRQLGAPVPLGFSPARLPHAGAPSLPFPSSWVAETVAPAPCPSLPAPDSALSASPDGDFTVSFRAAWWRSLASTPEWAAAACAPGGPAPHPGRYVVHQDRLGVPHGREGVFVRRHAGMVRLEVEAPVSKLPFVRRLFGAWETEVTAASF